MKNNITKFDEAFLTFFFENATTMVFVTANVTGEPIDLVSPNTVRILGYESEQLIETKVLYGDLIHDDDKANYLVESQQGHYTGASEQFVHSEYRLLHANKQYIWVKDTVQLVKRDGKIYQLIHNLTDISHEVLKTQEIQAQKDRLVSLLHTSGFGLWEWDTDKDFMICDTNWSHLLGFVDPVINLKISRLMALIHPDELTAFRSLLESLKANERTKGQITIRMRHLSGNWRYHLCNATLRQSQNKDNFLVTMSHNDITDQKENELAAIAALSTRNQFFARVSHEIRTPLHGMLGMLSQVKKDVVTEEVASKIDKIISISEQLLYLLNDILDLAKLNEAKLQVSLELTSITEVMKQAERLFSFKAKEKSIELRSSFPSLRSDMVMTDKVRITQVLSNLVSNAIKYTHSGQVHVFTKMDQENILLCVEDTGIGIKNTADIFDPYKQEDAGHAQGNNSTGLGLDIVRKLCDLLGVELRLFSSGAGTLFELVLGKPMPNSLAVSQSQSIESSDDIDFKDLSVLVVDDSDINREIVIEMLAGHGITCSEALDGYQAVKMTNNDNVFDVVLMDKHMPNMNGLDATYQIRENMSLKKQPVIIGLTADTFDSDNDTWFENGLNELVTKPFNLSILIKTIKRCLNKRSRGQ
ncbi:PAS domain-containing hybrid sensor histidine kinase/response regulator [Glaciecola petra]|uniref:histidine kinase n=1 Tax=Glaciecola petra TaxID=3075602 RepID=A0ABU2ZM54_9ALTE|nr:PAS domain-containing protein [Aestuariibacter sp. P117]MDT0593480.1 PAS domain-containing protein [Aestuariibacter sp. P117]